MPTSEEAFNPFSLPVVTQPMRLNDLPALLAPYAVHAPVFVYLQASGNLTACRMRRCDKELGEEDLILVLRPRLLAS